VYQTSAFSPQSNSSGLPEVPHTGEPSWLNAHWGIPAPISVPPRHKEDIARAENFIQSNFAAASDL